MFKISTIQAAKRSLIQFLIILSAVAFYSCSTTDDLQIDNSVDFEAFLNEEMDYQKIPALSILVFQNDQVRYERNLGKSHIDQNIDLESSHLFLLASVSKVITATALLQLYEQGRFQLDDPINNYLPFQVSIPNQSQSITFKMLLTHTSGIADGPSMDGQYYYDQDSPVGLGYFLEQYLVPGGEFYDAQGNFHTFAPGSKSEYSNIGNALIGHLVEQISGSDFNNYCKEHIFNPMGMNNSYWRLDEVNQTIVQPYKYESGRYQALRHYTFTDYPNGGLRSTATDLFQFFSAFVQDGLSNGNRLLKAETIRQMLTLQIPNIDSETGLHLFLMNQQHNLWGHDGGEEGVATMVAFEPELGTGVIILTNQGDADLDQILVEAYKMAGKL